MQPTMGSVHVQVLTHSAPLMILNIPPPTPSHPAPLNLSLDLGCCCFALTMLVRCCSCAVTVGKPAIPCCYRASTLCCSCVCTASMLCVSSALSVLLPLVGTPPDQLCLISEESLGARHPMQAKQAFCLVKSYPIQCITGVCDKFCVCYTPD